MDFLAAIPRGPQDRPFLLLPENVLEFDVDDVDGRMFMLDRDFGGSILIAFSKAMDVSITGTVTLGSEQLSYSLKPVEAAMNLWMLAVRVFGRLTKPGADYTLHVEGFTDTDGNTMLPTDVTVHTRERQLPEQQFAEREEIARRIAEEGIVLLENRGHVLPLASGQLNVFGHALHAFRTTVVGAGKINPRYAVGLREAVRESEAFTLNEELATFYLTQGDAVPDGSVLARARDASDLGIVVLTRASGENMDNSSDPGEFHLSAAEEQLLSAVTAAFSRTVVVLNTPYPMDTGFVQRYGVDGLVLAGVGGMLAGPALVRVLEGTVNPSGRLPDTWARSLDDIPASRNFYDCAGGKPRYTAGDAAWIDTAYEEGIYVGYRYFSTFDVDVAYPFGHGLSYTAFSVQAGEVNTPQTWTGQSTVGVDVIVRNTGARPGRHVVQGYLSKPDDDLEQPALELADFAKTAMLEPGESTTLRLRLPLQLLASYDEASACYIAPAGEYTIRVGSSVAETTVAGRFRLPEPVLVRQAVRRMLPVEPLMTLSKHDPLGSYPRGELSGIKADGGFTPARPSHLPDAPATATSSTVPPHSFADVQKDPSRVADFVAALSVPECARLLVCGQHGWGMEGTGVAGVLAQPEGLAIPQFQVADGNSGVNVNTPNIGLPTTVVLASTFDRALARDAGRVIGEEARAFSVNVILAPALNLHRHPLNGRHPEYFSEDPLLAGVLAGCFAEGLESTGVGACYKHVLANNAESSRKRNQSIIPERALRELYLRAFEIAMHTYMPKTIMTAYNAVNGTHTAADSELIDGIFRGEFGFGGMVMTDWGSYDTCDVVDMVIGGNNWITPGGLDETFTAPLVEAVSSGLLPEWRLRQSVSHLLQVVAELAPQ